MINIDLLRRAERANVLKQIGVDGRFQRVWTDHVQSAGLEAEILALPFYEGNAIEPVQSLQDASGTPLFMWGLSAWGSSDPHG